MENKKIDEAKYLLIVADTEERRIIVNERVSCIVGGFAKQSENKVFSSVHCIGFSSASPKLAFSTARAAEESARKVKEAAIEFEDDSLLGKIKGILKKIFGGKTNG